MQKGMKIKVRFKLEEERGRTHSVCRIAVGELKEPAQEYLTPAPITQNFFLLEGRNFFVDRHKQISESVQEETKQMFIPIHEVRSITVLPDALDIYNMEYKVSGNRLICQNTEQQVTLRGEGAAK